jgi:hypothetical protein
MTKKKREPIEVGEWSEPKTGTPTMVMFPARNFQFKVSKTEYTIEIPRKGNYAEIAPEIFDVEEGDFMVYDEDNAVIYLPSLTKILFAVEKYPALANNQLFAPIALLLDDDIVRIVGQVVEILPPEVVKSTVK